MGAGEPLRDTVVRLSAGCELSQAFQMLKLQANRKCFLHQIFYGLAPRTDVQRTPKTSECKPMF